MKQLELLMLQLQLRFVQDIDAFETIDLKYTYNMELGDTNVVLSAGINNAADEKLLLSMMLQL